MKEGIILLSESGRILSINQSASKILGISRYCVGKDLLLFNSDFEIQELLRIANNGTRCENVITINKRSYQFNASPVINGGKVMGIALIVFDITEKEKADPIRGDEDACDELEDVLGTYLIKLSTEQLGQKESEEATAPESNR